MDPREIFRRAYRGDPGVPHTDPGRYVQAWLGAFAVSAVACVSPHLRNIPSHFNWQDKALIFENNQWKKILQKKQQNSISSTSTSK